MRHNFTRKKKEREVFYSWKEMKEMKERRKKVEHKNQTWKFIQKNKIIFVFYFACSSIGTTNNSGRLFS
jgi:hypothetical protein